MAVTRPALGLPSAGSTFHVVGDTHAGPCPLWRYDAIAGDLKRFPTLPLVHFQIGDNTDNGGSTDFGYGLEYPKFLNFMARLPAPTYPSMGNHDTVNQTVAQWAATVGLASPNYIIDTYPVRLIVVEGEKATPPELSPSTLAFIDSSLAGTTKPCFLVTHFPPYNSVGGDPAKEYTSTTANFWCCTAAQPADSSDILAVLAAHSNFKAWISGHTHSRLTVPGLVMKMMAGSVPFAVINASSVWYQGRDHSVGGPLDGVPTVFVTWYDTGTIEVRFRDHNAGQWLSPNGSPVMSVTGLS